MAATVRHHHVLDNASATRDGHACAGWNIIPERRSITRKAQLSRHLTACASVVIVVQLESPNEKTIMLVRDSPWRWQILRSHIREFYPKICGRIEPAALAPWLPGRKLGSSNMRRCTRQDHAAHKFSSWSFGGETTAASGSVALRWNSLRGTAGLSIPAGLGLERTS